MREILESHPVANLKKELAKLKKSLNYSKLKKSELIDLMMKPNLRDNFKHLKMYVKPTPKAKPTPKPKPAPKPKPKPAPKPKAKPAPKPKEQPKPKPAPKPKEQPKPKPAPEPKPEPKKENTEADRFYENLNDFLKGSKRQVNNLRKNFTIDENTIKKIFEAQSFKDFFPTPKICVDKLPVQRCNKILEGTAGLGSVVYYMKKRFPNLEVVANELEKDFIPIIKKYNPGVKVINQDFFKLNDKFDCIFLNPPFSRGGRVGKRFGGNKGAPFYFDFLFHAVNMIKDLGKGYSKNIYFISPPIHTLDKKKNITLNEFLTNIRMTKKQLVELLNKYGDLKTNEKEINQAIKDEDFDEILMRNEKFGLGYINEIRKIGTCSGFGGTGQRAEMYDIELI
jgi:molecular chaperone GrpE (heat shock protein)